MNLITRTSIAASEIASFVTRCKALSEESIDNISLNSLNILLNNLSQSTTNLKLYNPDTAVEIIPSDIQATTVITTPNDYMGIKSIVGTIKPLETLVMAEKLTPQLTTANIIINPTSDNYSGLDTVTFSEIALSEKFQHKLVEEDLKGVYENGQLNIKTFNFATNNKFGTKSLELEVPIFGCVTLNVNADNNNYIFYPADLPPDLDGTGGIDAKIGIQAIKLGAVRSTLTYGQFFNIARDLEDTVVKTAASITDASGNHCICFDSIQIPGLVESTTFWVDREKFWSNIDQTVSFVGDTICGTREIVLQNMPISSSISWLDFRYTLSSMLKAPGILCNTTDTEQVFPLQLSLNLRKDDGDIILTNLQEQTSVSINTTDLAHNYDYIDGLDIITPAILDTLTINNIDINIGEDNIATAVNSGNALLDDNTKLDLKCSAVSFDVNLDAVLPLLDSSLYYDSYSNVPYFKIKQDSINSTLVVEPGHGFDEKLQQATNIISSLKYNNFSDLATLDNIEICLPHTDLYCQYIDFDYDEITTNFSEYKIEYFSEECPNGIYFYSYISSGPDPILDSNPESTNLYTFNNFVACEIDYDLLAYCFDYEVAQAAKYVPESTDDPPYWEVLPCQDSSTTYQIIIHQFDNVLATDPIQTLEIGLRLIPRSGLTSYQAGDELPLDSSYITNVQLDDKFNPQHANIILSSNSGEYRPTYHADLSINSSLRLYLYYGNVFNINESYIKYKDSNGNEIEEKLNQHCATDYVEIDLCSKSIFSSDRKQYIFKIELGT